MSLPHVSRPAKSVLDPIARLSEVLFGLIMVLTFTLSLNAAQAGQGEVRTMLLGALGCNLAWGIIDAAFYLMTSEAEKGEGLKAFRAVRGEANPQAAQRIIADALPPVIASVMQPAELEVVHLRLKQLPEPSRYIRISRDDCLGAVGVFLAVFLSTLPVVIPFTFMHDVSRALRISNAIAVVLLFVAGFYYGRITERSPMLLGLGMVVLAFMIVGMTMALGG